MNYEHSFYRNNFGVKTVDSLEAINQAEQRRRYDEYKRNQFQVQRVPGGYILGGLLSSTDQRVCATPGQVLEECRVWLGLPSAEEIAAKTN